MLFTRACTLGAPPIRGSARACQCLFGANEFPPMDDFLRVPEAIATVATEDTNGKKRKIDDSKLKPEGLEDYDTEELLHLFAKRHADFMGTTLKTLMVKTGISGQGGKADDKAQKIHAACVKVGIHYNDDGTLSPLACTAEVDEMITKDLPPWMVEHAPP